MFTQVNPHFGYFKPRSTDYHIKKHRILPQCIYVSRTIFTMNSEYLSKQYQPGGLYNAEVRLL